MSEPPSKDDPTATYRGYRRQTLYCLSRLFDDALPEDSVLEPEGIEDLALYDQEGKLIEIAQVKDLSDNLTASSFKPTFYERIAEYCRPESEVAVTIVSFGPVGPELLNALGNTRDIPNRVLETLTKDREVKDRAGSTRTVKGLLSDIARNILRHVTLTEVNEDELTQTLIAKLSRTVSAGDPERAFENLMWWLTTSAETRRRLTRANVVKKLNEIGTFLSHLAAFHHEWNTSIIPIQVPDDGRFDRSTLEREFFLGGRVRADHVAANLDVRRPELLHQIHSAFERENVVVIRAASGQGKTTLAYRYVLDFAPRDFRFEALRASDLQHARRMATAVSGHSEALDVPTLVYVDVRPGDTLWVEFVRELSSTPDVRVLVTVREEDWFRSRVSLDDFRFVDLPIDFDESAGREIYGRLEDRASHTKYLDFDDAWAQLGERKTLFEFVYLVTQAESLAVKIDAQIASLQDAVNSHDLLPGELYLLRLVAVASAYEARVQLAPLAESCQLPEPQRTLERFNREFLLRTSDDGRYVEGFHAIRSELIASRLTDPVLNPWSNVALQALPLLDENDLETFLLCSFARRPESRDDLLAGLKEFIPKTWVGVRGASVALQWVGLDAYTSANGQLVDNVRTAFGGGWWFILDWDLAQVCGLRGIDFLEPLRNTSREFTFAAESATTLRRQQTDKNAAFSYFRDWIENLDGLPDAPRSIPDFVAVAEVMYWVGHLGVAASITRWLTEERLDEAFMELPIHLFAEFAAAARAVSDDTYRRWHAANHEAVEKSLRRETGAIALVEDGDCLVAHYVIDLDRRASRLRRRPLDQSRREDVEVEVNELSVERVEILSRCIPGYEEYGANGYGHRMSLLSTLGDESQKRMPVENILMPWLPEFNSLARGLAELRFRPGSWEDYLQNICSMRQQVVAAFGELAEAVQRIRPDSKLVLRDVDAWDRCKATVNGDFFLPQTAVDEWGFVTESRSSRYSSTRADRFTAISRLDLYNKAVNEYTRTVGNFMQQTLQSLVLIPHLRVANTDAKRKAVLAKAKELGINERSIRLSVANGVDACIALKELQRQESMLFGEEGKHRLTRGFLDKERWVFVETMRKWCQFAYPNQFPSPAPKKKRNRVRRTRELRDCLKPTRNRINACLRSLAGVGVRAELVSDEIEWDTQTALWITFDTNHPLESLIAVERLWHALVGVFEPDRDKIVRMKAVDFYWKRIVFVPLVQGRSVEKQAFANMSGVTHPLQQDVTAQLWRFFLEPVPSAAWEQLCLPSWERQSTWDIFDQFAAAYSALFHHVDHMTDFTRCKIDIDEFGQSVFQDYLLEEIARAQPMFQETIDSAARVLGELPEWTEETVNSRSDMLACTEFLIQMKGALLPTEDFEDEAKLTIDQIADWRDRLKSGFDLLGQARYLWIADSLGLDGFDSRCFFSVPPSLSGPPSI